MKRFSVVAVVFSVLCLGTIDSCFAEDSACPPGARFCPVPGLSGGGETGGTYGMESEMAYGAQSFDSQSFFEGQLNEGEQLIMVAPSGQPDFTGQTAALYGDAYGSDTYSDSGGSYPASGGTYSAQPVYADSGAQSSGFDEYSVAGSTMPTMTEYQMTGQESDGFASAYSDDFSRDFSQTGFDGEMQAPSPMPGYIPPPPSGRSGTVASSRSMEGIGAMGSMPAAPSHTLYEESEGFASVGQSPSQSAGRNYRPKKGSGGEAVILTSNVPSMEMPKTAPRGYVREEMTSSDDFEMTPPSRAATASQNKKRSRNIPSREDVAQVRSGKRNPDMLSEVANETSRKSSRLNGSEYGDGFDAPSSSAYHRVDSPGEDRVPWWKGGAWRNRRAKRVEKEAIKSEARARKEREKREKERALERAERDRAERRDKDKASMSKKDPKRR